MIRHKLRDVNGMLKCWPAGQGICSSEVFIKTHKLPTVTQKLIDSEIPDSGHFEIFFTRYLPPAALSQPEQECNVFQLQPKIIQEASVFLSKALCQLVMAAHEFHHLPWLTDRSHVIWIESKTKVRSELLADLSSALCRTVQVSDQIIKGILLLMFFLCPSYTLTSETVFCYAGSKSKTLLTI